MPRAALREVVFRLALRPGAVPESLPLVLASGTTTLVVETSVTHLDEKGNVWRILHVRGAPDEVRLARARFDAYEPPFLAEKRVLGDAPGRLVLWYAYKARSKLGARSQTALAFRRLGRATVLTDATRAGEITFRVLAAGGPAMTRWLAEATKLAEPKYDLALLYTGPPRDPASADLTPDEERTLAAAHAAGFFGVPRKAGTRDVAKRVGASPSAVSARLRRAEEKLVRAHLGV